MSQIDIFQHLKSISFFNFLPENVINVLAREVEVEVFPKQSIIITQGQLGDKIYFLLEGKAEAYLFDKHGKEIVIAELEKNNYFGELALIANQPRVCSIRAISNCILASLSKDKFNKVTQRYPQVYQSLNNIISKRLTETMNLVADKKKNYLILLIENHESTANVNEFLEYFKTISNKPIKLIEALDNFPNDDHYIFIKTSPEKARHFYDRVDAIINFVEKQDHQFSISPGSSRWHMENIARRIAKKTIGIALCSGGAPAAAHLGVMETLQKANVPIDYIVGSSAGALFGACFAFKHDYENILKYLVAENKRNPLKTILLQHPNNFSGLIKTHYYRKIFKEFFGDANIEDAFIPFAAVASDLFTGETIVLDKGNAVEAILASNAAPVIIEPVRMGDKLLIDGVATAPLPIQTLVKNSIDIKIAVPIPQLDLSVSMKNNPKIPTVYIRSRSMMVEEIMNKSLELADVIIAPEVKGIKIVDWKNTDKVIEAGRQAAEMALKRIQYLFRTK